MPVQCVSLRQPQLEESAYQYIGHRQVRSISKLRIVDQDLNAGVLTPLKYDRFYIGIWSQIPMQSYQKVEQVVRVFARPRVRDAENRRHFLIAERRERNSKSCALFLTHMPCLESLNLAIRNPGCEEPFSSPVNDLDRFGQNQKSEQDNTDYLGNVMNAPDGIKRMPSEQHADFHACDCNDDLAGLAMAWLASILFTIKFMNWLAKKK